MVQGRACHKDINAVQELESRLSELTSQRESTAEELKRQKKTYKASYHNHNNDSLKVNQRTH